MSERRNAFRRMAIVFVIGALAVGVVMGAIAFGSDTFSPLEVILFSIAIGCLAASFAALSSVWNSRAVAESIFAADASSRRAVTRAVVRGKDEPLDDAQRSTAVRLAEHLRNLMPVQFAQSFLVIIAVTLIQIPNLFRGDDDLLTRVLFGFLAACFVVAVVFSVVQYRNVSRYAATHAVA